MTIIKSIFSLPFTGKNFYRGIVENEDESFGKDAAYELLKCPSYNWRTFDAVMGQAIRYFGFDTLNCQESKVVT